MHMTIALAIVLLCCDLCQTIRVPTVWNDGDKSDVQNVPNPETIYTSPLTLQQQKIPTEYFEYTANKPQFAIDVAAFHGVQSPENYYKAYPVRPYTGQQKPELGKHQILDKDNKIYQPFQKYVQNTQHITPVSSNYEVFHPYKAEEPALQELYKDPILEKIRNDIRSSNKEHENYVKEAGKPNVSSDEYLESVEESDHKKVPHRNVPARYEIHRPQRRPAYYKLPPKYNYHHHLLNQKFKHPLHQNYIKVRPENYRPLQTHLQRLRQHHALTYDDDNNEYPQLPPSERLEAPPEGYDIFEKGKAKYLQLKNNVDESINAAIKENRPTNYQRLELQSNADKIQEQTTDDESEFVPVKNYAQVRKTETVKHLPKEAALDDAETYEEIRNAPRLKEAVKSSKAQTVYSEEGYEDTAYDHAGEQKHASDHEAHGGYLNENENSGGKYKIPSLAAGYSDSKGAAYRDQNLHGQKWNNDNKDEEKENQAEDYSEDEAEQDQEADVYTDNLDSEDKNERNKRENESENSSEITDELNNTNTQHDVNKREINFEVPLIDINTTFLTKEEIKEISKQKLEPIKSVVMQKYPYYNKNNKSIHKDSPLRYAENLKLIPQKSKSSTAFYDSRSKFECPEVDDNVDPIPDKIKNKEIENSDEEESPKNKVPNDEIDKQPRLQGLGDKIDCFKAKYFGKNPLDSPFFNEDLISNPEPVSVPITKSYRLKSSNKFLPNNDLRTVFNFTEELKKDGNLGIESLLENVNDNNKKLQEKLIKINDELKKTLQIPQTSLVSSTDQTSQQTNIYHEIINNFKNNTETEHEKTRISNGLLQPVTATTDNTNITYQFQQNDKNVTKVPSNVRRKRAAPFVYEPYKIIRDGQFSDSKKTTTSSNISPLIKQLQSSKIVDRVTKTSQDKDQPVKRNVATRTYKDIGKKDRVQSFGKNNKESLATDFVDVSIDQRRGEPRYEIRPAKNHKSVYTPVENKKAMPVDEYKSHKISENKTNVSSSSRAPVHFRQRPKQIQTTVQPFFDVSKFLTKPTENEDLAASNIVRKTITTTTPSTTRKSLPIRIKTDKAEIQESEEDYDEGSDEEYEDEEDESTTIEVVTTTTTTQKPILRKRIRLITTTEKSDQEVEEPKLRLRTRFRDSIPNTDFDTKPQKIDTQRRKHKEEPEIVAPKFREKKRKTTKSTLVTDTNVYGRDNNEDELRKEEVDSLIGVKHNMDEYMPQYEKEIRRENEENNKQDYSSSEEEDDYDDIETRDNENDNEDEDEDDDDEEEDSQEDNEEESEATTQEPLKQTLPRTTEAPSSTTESRNAKLELKPIIKKMKIEIHKELPVNKTSPHVTQFKQDIKEVEIIKESPVKSPRRKPQKNLEALELYKDDNLAKDINKLRDVEVFKGNLDLKMGPKHGGNYKSAKITEMVETPLRGGNLKIAKMDTDVSQSENQGNVELDEVYPNKMHGGNLKHVNKNEEHDINIDEKNAKFTELSDVEETIIPKSMHGGNLRFIQARHNSERNGKLVELDDSYDEDDDALSASDEENHKSNSNTRNHMHGGNYRSAKIVQVDNVKEDKISAQYRNAKESTEGPRDPRRNAALLLNSFAQVAPILTTTPSYILDPSKRMYYYVDA